MRQRDLEIIAARRYFAQFQRPTPQSIQSRALEDAIRAKHTGGTT